MTPNDPKAKTVAELRKIAGDLDISGRSAMRKDELIAAIAAATPSPAAAPAGEKAAAAKAAIAAALAGKKAAVPARPATAKKPAPVKATPQTAAPKNAAAAPKNAAAATAKKPAPVKATPQAAAPKKAAAPKNAAAPVVAAVEKREPTQPPPLSHVPAPPREPGQDDVYIDRGAIIPDTYPGSRVRVMVRDPSTLFVYWEIPGAQGAEGWEVGAVDAMGGTREAFRVDRTGGHGYLHVPTAEVARVTLRPVVGGWAGAPVAEVAVPQTAGDEAPAGTAAWVEGAFDAPTGTIAARIVTAGTRPTAGAARGPRPSYGGRPEGASSSALVR